MHEHLMSRFTAVLQSMPSPLEIGACIAVVDVIEGNNYFQMALAVTSLFLAVCERSFRSFCAAHREQLASLSTSFARTPKALLLR